MQNVRDLFRHIAALFPHFDGAVRVLEGEFLVITPFKDPYTGENDWKTVRTKKITPYQRDYLVQIAGKDMQSTVFFTLTGMQIKNEDPRVMMCLSLKTLIINA